VKCCMQYKLFSNHDIWLLPANTQGVSKVADMYAQN
jgi:hypothetical protein